jgi:nucleotide-binding universal stress UspA family protein
MGDMDDAPILICYDGSAGAQRAIEAAAKLFGPRRAVVLDVAPPLTPAESVALTTSITPGAAFEELNMSGGLEVAREGVEHANAAGFIAEARTYLAAPAWEGIVEIADELDAPLIVMGTRGLRGLREQVEGSLSHEIAQHSGRPVLIVPPARS